MTSKQPKYKYANRRDKSNFGKRLATIVIIVTMLIFITTSVGIPTDESSTSKYGLIHPNMAIAASSLAEVSLLEGVEVTAELSNVDGDEPYHVLLSLTGTGLADAELASPERVAIFFAPDLARGLTVDGSANVRVEILPITMDDLLALNTALEGLQSTLSGLVTGLISDINDALPTLISPSLVEINGLDELNAAIDNLNNLNTALADVLAYEGLVDAVVNADGSIVASFSDGLGNHLETVVKDIVQSALDDVSNAVNNLEINILSGLPLVGNLLKSLTNDLLLPLVGNVTGELTSLTGQLTDGTIDLSNDLAGVQVIGNTTVNLDATVDKELEVFGGIPVYGTAVNDSAIHVPLLADSADVGTINFPPPAPVVEKIYSTDKFINGTAEPESQITVTFSDDTTATGATDSVGNFSIPIPKGTVLKEKVEITVTDAYHMSKPTQVHVIEAMVSITVPEILLFEITMIDSTPTTILREEPDWSIQVIDTRREGSKWRLNAEVDEPLTLVSSQNHPHTLPNALVYIEDNNSTPMEDGPLEVYSGEKNIPEEEVTCVSWEADQGPLLQLVPADAYVGEYKTTITWTLIDAP